MRKLLMGAVIASASLVLAGAAIAQTANDASLKVTLSPSKAGTKEKPKSHSLRTQLTVEKPGTTVGVIQLGLSKGLKFSGKGFKKCDKETLIAGGPTACPDGSAAGPMGSALAAIEPANTPLQLDIYPFVGANNTFYIYVDTLPYGLAIQDVLTGEITNKGRKMRITIPDALRQPVEGLDATLKEIDQTFSGKRGKNGIVTSTTCKNKKHKVTGTLEFAPRLDGNPVPEPDSISAKAKCKK